MTKNVFFLNKYFGVNLVSKIRLFHCMYKTFNKILIKLNYNLNTICNKKNFKLKEIKIFQG